MYFLNFLLHVLKINLDTNAIVLSWLLQYKDDHGDESEGDGEWEYVEDGPAEIIWQGNEITVKKKKVKVPKKAKDKPPIQEVQILFVIKFCGLFSISLRSKFLHSLKRAC